eukprot:scaffold1705_cov304-Prasinococcus_capsulatus_cf.AAC.7
MAPGRPAAHPLRAADALVSAAAAGQPSRACGGCQASVAEAAGYEADAAALALGAAYSPSRSPAPGHETAAAAPAQPLPVRAAAAWPWPCLACRRASPGARRARHPSPGPSW